MESNRILKARSKAEHSQFLPLLDAFILDCKLRNLTASTIDGHAERVGYLTDYLGEIEPEQLMRRHIDQYVLSLIGKVSEATVNGRLRVYRRFFNFLQTEELISNNPMHGVRLLKTSHKLKPVLGPQEIQMMIDAINKRTFEGHRNLVLLLLFWDGMIRQKEALGIKLGDLDLTSRTVVVDGKGRRQRVIPIGVVTARVISQYLAKWRRQRVGDYLLCMRNGQPINPRRCHRIIQQLGEKADMKVYPHLLRHSGATYYIRNGGNIAILQRILGHSTLTVTQNYLHLSTADMVSNHQVYSPSNSLRL